MISWMQKHNKYLVWTIWVSTIAFIGAGFVGWGSYNFSSKAGNIAQVGDIGISQNKLNMAYSNIYNQYNQMMQGKLDEEKAKKMGLIQQAFAMVATQAKVLNYAKANGIIVSDEELVKRLETINIFQDKGKFSKVIYQNFLQNQRMTAKTFEENLREEMIITKTLDLLHVDALPFEEKVIGSAINIADKIAYKVYSLNDTKVDLNESAIKSYWESHKDGYMTNKQYKLSIVWTPSSDANVTDKELQAHFNANSFNYTDAQGKQLSFTEAKDRVTKEVKLLKTKKEAQKDYIAFKKGEIKNAEQVTLPLNSLQLSTEIWKEISQKPIGEILKPKIVTDRYATVKIDEFIQPNVMTFDEAKALVTAQYKVEEQKKALHALAEKTLKNFDETNATTSSFLSLNQNVNLNQLNSEQSLQFVNKLFTSTEEKGMISVADNIVVYKVIAQKVLPIGDNMKTKLQQSVNQIKRNTFEGNFIKGLDKQYPTEVYREGLTN